MGVKVRRRERMRRRSGVVNEPLDTRRSIRPGLVTAWHITFPSCADSFFGCHDSASAGVKILSYQANVGRPVEDMNPEFQEGPVFRPVRTTRPFSLKCNVKRSAPTPATAGTLLGNLQIVPNTARLFDKTVFRRVIARVF
ncbi:hypothetical protein PA01_08605 [Azoarcus sp. PA01]|nr:hypothetical protein PA01_08605 [Azoarcus sp. PA01]